MNLIEKPRIGIIAPSIAKKPWGGLEYQVFHLVKNLDIDPVFIFEEEPSPALDVSYQVVLPRNLEKTAFELRSSIIRDRIKGFILFSSWDADSWLDVFKRLPDVPLLYSERSCPELVIERWDEFRRRELLERANKIHMFYKEYSKVGHGSEVDRKRISEKIFYFPNVPFKFYSSKMEFLYAGAINRYPKRVDLQY